MAHQASQVFYVKDPSSEHWYVVLHGKKQEAVSEHEPSNIDIGETRSFTSIMVTNVDDHNEDDDEVYDGHAARKDHDEGIYI